ncbi:MAG: hypothetical protein ACM3ML_37430 [Micromonosporaceae bacterium]
MATDLPEEFGVIGDPADGSAQQDRHHRTERAHQRPVGSGHPGGDPPRHDGHDGHDGKRGQ